MAPAQPLAVSWREGDAARLAAGFQGRSRRHEFVGRNTLSVPGRRRIHLLGVAASALEAAWLARQADLEEGGPALDSQGDRLAAQGHVPGTLRRFSRGEITRVRGPASQSRIARADRLFRSRGGEPLAAGVSHAAARFQPTHHDRDGPGRRGCHATLASYVYR